MNNSYDYISHIFNPDNPNVIFVDINGSSVPVVEKSDSHGNYLAIPALKKELSNICGKVICNHTIKEIDYNVIDNKPVIIKAYY